LRRWASRRSRRRLGPKRPTSLKAQAKRGQTLVPWRRCDEELMAKIRAYKLAEELGIERSEIVEKAAAVGVELKTAMSSLDEEDAEKLREKYGEKAVKQVVSEKRVTRKGGSAVIRRRKKAEPEPEPELEPVAAVEEAAEPEPIAAEAEPEPSEVEVAPEPPLGEEVAASAEAPAAEEPESPAVSEPRPARPGPDSAVERLEGKEGKEGKDGKEGKQRKLVREVVNLREQERLARQATGRGPIRRQVTVDPRAMTSPRRRRRDAVAPRPVAAAPKEAKRVVRVEGGVSVGDLFERFVDLRFSNQQITIVIKLISDLVARTDPGRIKAQERYRLAFYDQVLN